MRSVALKLETFPEVRRREVPNRATSCARAAAGTSRAVSARCEPSTFVLRTSTTLSHLLVYCEVYNHLISNIELHCHLILCKLLAFTHNIALCAGHCLSRRSSTFQL